MKFLLNLENKMLKQLLNPIRASRFETFIKLGRYSMRLKPRKFFAGQSCLAWDGYYILFAVGRYSEQRLKIFAAWSDPKICFIDRGQKYDGRVWLNWYQNRPCAFALVSYKSSCVLSRLARVTVILCDSQDRSVKTVISSKLRFCFQKLSQHLRQEKCCSSLAFFLNELAEEVTITSDSWYSVCSRHWVGS